MANTLLHPIVIQAVISGSFECLGEGLLHEGVGREEPNVLKDLIAPTKTSKRVPIEDRERPKKWWKAQCIHYGLQVPSTASISTYRVHLENAIRQRGGLKRPQHLTDLELEQNARFLRLNVEVREATSGAQAKPPKGKAKSIQPAPVVTLEHAPAPVPKTKVKSEPKAKPEPKTRAPKTEPKTKTGPKAKLSGDATSTSETTPALKTTITKKRKAETIVHHVYHYDGDRADQIVTTSITNQETVKRPTKKARTVAPQAPVPTPHAPPPDLPPRYSQVVPRTAPTTPGAKQTARRHRFWRFNGQYELSCTSEEEWPSPRGCKPSIRIRFGEGDEPEFEGFLELPGLMFCMLRLKVGAPRPEDGYVWFEWCGREEGMGEILTPSTGMVGWLKVHHDHEQVRSHVKGMITGRYGEFTFNGKKVGPDELIFQTHKWDDFGEKAYKEANRRRWR
ncbi:unnamed protein product [Rhizoctonia solani]|uniref:Uncharacterized protein n=1 Tax=Rhizoctonia solani TaxID=456999 RepID=A0A8H3D7U0_9AGAM|nr:unnamed protein product [Rhizoctonia solani]